MNLHGEFRRILLTYGYDVLLIRRNRKRKCDCSQNFANEIDRSCPKCFGLGYHFIAERHTTRSEDVSVPETLARLTRFTKLGDINYPSRQYFFLPDVVIEEGDIIVDYRLENGQWKLLTNALYVVNHIDQSEKINSSQPVYFRVYAGDEPIQKEARIKFLVEIKNIHNYSLKHKDIDPPVASPTTTPVQSISIKQDGQSITSIESATGNIVNLTADVTPSNATDKKLIWSSVNKSVFTVNQQGQVTITGMGTALLGVSSADGKCVTFIQVKGT